MPKHYYLDISLNFPNGEKYEISPHYFKNNIITAIGQLFGQVGASVEVDLLKYNLKTKRGIIRVPAEYYVKIRSSLTLCGDYAGDKCFYTVHKASPLLLSLQGDSRDYQH